MKTCTATDDCSAPSLPTHQPEFLWSPTRTELITTKFMRNRLLFSTLAHELLPRLRKEKGRPLRMLFWACSTGAEPYTLKFLLGADSADEITGIDYDAEAVRTAQVGVYHSDTWTMFFDGRQKLLTAGEVEQFFDPASNPPPETRRIKDAYRQNMTFLAGNLFAAEPAAPLKSFDLVVCDNLLLHLKDGSASAAWDYLHRYMTDDGMMLVAGCNPTVRAAAAQRLNLVPCPEKLSEISQNWAGVSGAWNFKDRPAWAYPEPDPNDPLYAFQAGELFKNNPDKSGAPVQAFTAAVVTPLVQPKNIIISGSSFWNPGDDFVREGVIRVLRETFHGEPLNFLFYNFNPDILPNAGQQAFSNVISQGDLEKFRDHVDAIVIVGVAAGHELKPLYRWMLDNDLASKVYLISGHYESPYAAEHIVQEPEASIFRQARLLIGRTNKYPDFIRDHGLTYHRVNCPALLSVPEVKNVPAGKKIERIGFSIQLPPDMGGIINQSCGAEPYRLAMQQLHELAKHYQVEVVTHHKTEYFHFLKCLAGTGIPVIFSSFYHDLFATYRRYDLVVTTRLHTSLFSNGHGIPGIIINDTDRHTHALEGFLHSPWVNTQAAFEAAFQRWQQADLAAVARESHAFKTDLIARYVQILRPAMNPQAPQPVVSAPTVSTPHTSLEGARRILFVRTDSIGDAVLASSMLEPLRQRYPEAKLAVLCQQHVAELFAACPFVDSVICYDRKQVESNPAERAQILPEIAAFQPDVVLNSVRPRDKFSNDLTLAIKGAHLIAIEGDLENITPADHASARSRYDFVIPTTDAFRPELTRHVDFLRGLGIETAALQPVVWTSPDHELLADEFFKTQQLDPQKTIAVFPGAQHDVRVYRRYADTLKDLTGYHFLIFGDAAQTALAEEIALQLPERTTNLCGRSSLIETVALLRRCRLYVGAESGGAHIACAIGLPNVILLGGGHFARFMPYSPLTSAVSLPLECFSCSWRCTHSRAHCVKDIAPGVIARAIREALEKTSSRTRLYLQAKTTGADRPGLPKWQRPDALLSGMDVEIIEVDPALPTAPTAADDAGLILIPAIPAGPEPLVSVIVATYNAEELLRPCLENLTRQTIFDRCEILVIDNGSKQNERAIVLEFQQKYPNIRYVFTPRPSLYGAWNCGLKLARGRYWVNANTDDSMRDDALEVMAAAMAKNPECVLGYCDVAWTVKPNDTFPSQHIIKTVKYPDYAPVYTLFYCVTGCLQFWRTEAIRELGGFDATTRAAGDFEPTIKMMNARMNVVHVPEVMSLFYQNRTGLTQGSTKSAEEHDDFLNRYRANLDIANVFQIEPGNRSAVATAWAALGTHASKFTVPWEDAACEHTDFAFECFHAALKADPENIVAGMSLLGLCQKLKRLNPDEAGLIQRYPKMREWIASFRAGERIVLPQLRHTVLGPAYRPGDWAQRPTSEQLAREPKSLHPWITRIDGRHVYLSEDLFPRPAGLHYLAQELDAAAKRLVALIADLPPFHAHFGGAGDALLLLAAFYDQQSDGVVFCHPNGVGAAKALFDAFPKLSKIYFLPQQAEPFFHIVLRYAVYELKNCRGAGTTPQFGYEEEWKASLDITKKYGIKKSPRWAAAMRQNAGSKKIALAPRGSLSGMIGSKKNIILPELWPQVIAHIVERGFEPVILGVPGEAKDYPALPGCMDARGESFPGQMKLIGQSAGLVGADSWAKTFSALAEIPTLVFEPIKGADLNAWKDPSDWVFIEPWPSIKMIRSLEDFKKAFDARIAKLPGAEEVKHSKPVIAWEGSFLDYGSLSHVNRALTAHLPGVTCVGPNILPGRAKSDSEMKRCASKLAAKAPANTAVTVRHQWPPNWSRPQSGLLVVIQPWEFGALPKAWVEQSANVDEFWVPSPLVRHMYVDSGIAPEKVRVVPNGVDSQKFRPGVPALKLATKRKFKFLFVGGTIYRKGPDILLEAFTKTFTAADDVCLVIKDFGGDSFYQGQTAEATIEAFKKNPNAPEILYLQEELSSEQMPSLYAACDCLVLPYRGEGFGMPVLEAMACGLPVVVTAGGATESFVTAEAGWKIPSQPVYIGERVGDIQLVKNGWLMEPSKPHLGAIMKFALSRPEECRKRGAAGRVIVERRFDWSDVAAAVSHRLKELSERSPVKSITAPAPAVTNRPATAKTFTLPAVAKIGRLDEARELFAAKKSEAAWNAALAAVAQRPFHPEAFLLLAEIAQAAGDANNAKLCHERALSFAPGFKAAKNFKLRKNADAAKVGLPSSILNLPPSPRISVCLITKNEEKFLTPCLKSIRSLASQIIVVDTGSTDRTVEIAREFGAEVYAFAWCHDFAAARNEALEHATGDWVLILDADEELTAPQHANLLADMRQAAMLGFRLPLVNAGQENEGRSFIPRLFRNAPGVFFHGRIHEQVFPSLLPLCKQWGLQTALGTAELLHYGYTKELVRDRNKVERNLKLLRLAIDENPIDANLLMNLGLELVRSGDLAAGITKYREAFGLMSTQPTAEIVPELREALLTQFTTHLYKVRGHHEIVEALTSPFAKNNLTASLHLALGLAYFELRQFGEAAGQMRQCLATNQQPALTPINVDIHSAAPWHCLALCLARSGDAPGAEAAFQSAITHTVRNEEARLDYARYLRTENRAVEALTQLNEIVARNPASALAWKLGGEISLAHAEFIAFARDWTGEAFVALPNNAAIAAQRAEALLLNGDTAAALELWGKLWSADRQPRTLAALILCEVIESQTTHAPEEGRDETATSQAFIEWYQRLITVRASTVAEKLNEQPEKLSRALPTAAQMLHTALAEAVAT